MKRVVEYSLALMIDTILIMSIVSNIDVEVKSYFGRVTSSLRVVVDYTLMVRELVNNDEVSSPSSFEIVELHGPRSGLTVLYLRV